jgi:hypothetical protein
MYDLIKLAALIYDISNPLLDKLTVKGELRPIIIVYMIIST